MAYVELEVWVSTEKEMYAAKLKTFGLTAYGRTYDEAVQKVMRLKGCFLEVNKNNKRVKEVLDGLD